MKIKSSAFEHQGSIPAKYTCEGDDISPPLTFSGIPAEAESLVLILDDPDAPMGTFDHWLVWNLPPKQHHLSEGAKNLPVLGRNDFEELRYRGPCPPPGKPHRYFFKLYALDIQLDLPEGSSKDEVEEAMKGHILDKAELIGIYQR
jgi:Raf kinase inhibitor-like YbhB/YbcL family protein